MVENRKPGRWALILGASSGFGAAAALALAQEGFDIAGVHLDRRATAANVERITTEIQRTGRQTMFFNVNAADPDRRAEVIHSIQKIAQSDPDFEGVCAMLHSLAFGTLKPYLADPASGAIKAADMNMTVDVMAHSLVYWVQDLFAAGLLKEGAKI